jgi:hypothetical protein
MKKSLCVFLFGIIIGLSSCAKVEQTSVVLVHPEEETDKPCPTSCAVEATTGSDVSIIDKGRYYQVVLDYEHGGTPCQIGEAYGQAIIRAVPDFEKNVDSYLAEIACLNGSDAYCELIRRAQQLKQNIPQEYREEIEALAKAFSGGTTNQKGDGKLSVDEIYLMSLVPDVARAHQCSVLSVFGPRSTTGKTITGRVLDWPSGSNHQVEKLQAVIVIRNFEKSICLIGYVGLLGCISGFNNDHIFAAILDSPTGEPFSIENKRSYTFDLRYALENQNTLSKVAGFMADPKRNYTFNHLIVLSDAKRSGILENNISGKGKDIRRALREDNSPLNNGIEWNFPNAVCAVNAFMLKGNHDNFTGVPSNVERWNNFKSELRDAGETVSAEQLKQIVSFYPGADPASSKGGNIYNCYTQQIIIYQPATDELEIFFRPRNGELPVRPVFEKVNVDF